MPGPPGPPPRTWIVLHRLRRPLAVSAVAVAASSVGYVTIAGYPWFDALYMTFITLSTIGYGEVHPLETPGKLWTMAMIIGGFGLLVYTTAVLTGLVVSGELGMAVRERRSQRVRESLRDHVIVVGYGRVGRAVTQAVCKQGRACIVVDRDPAVVEAVCATGAVALSMDGMQEDTLRRAGIERARALVAAAPDDPTNLLVVLTARALRPDLRIVARVNGADWHDRIVRAGASVALSPYDDFGAGLAASAVNESVLGLHELAGLDLETEEIVVRPSSPLVGQAVADIAQRVPRLLVLGIRRSARDEAGRGSTIVHQITGPLQPGDVVVAIGAKPHIEQLQQAL